MPYCPNCGYEYEEGIEMCPDCEVETVEYLSEDHFSGEMVEVFSSYSVSEAGMVKELLYNEGIFSAISNEFGASMLGSASADISEVKVFVGDEDEEKARELIEAYIEENPLDEKEDFIICSHCGQKVDEGSENCPYCGEPFED